MDIKEILSKCDHTLLSVTSTREQIEQLCDDAVKYQTASVCIPPAYIAYAKQYTEGKIPICTVIGFPNGYSTAASKAFETADAVEQGADEIDMVINVGFLKDRRFDDIASEIKMVRNQCKEKVLKVIIETCLLDEEEKIKMCEIVTECGADFIKTSTGFSKAGATFEDIELFSKHIGPKVRMKAAGGIKSLEDAERFINLGCSRLGTSSIVRIVKEKESKGEL